MKEEILDVVDDDDQFVRTATRSEVRENSLMHRVARAIVFKKSGKLLVQKRSKHKKTFPSHWDIGVAETVKSKETYEKAALRGLSEEMSIKAKNIAFLFKIVYNSKMTNEHCSIYEINHEGGVVKQEEEIDEIDFLSAEGIRNLIKKEKFHPVGKLIFEKYLEYNSMKKCR